LFGSDVFLFSFTLLKLIYVQKHAKYILLCKVTIIGKGYIFRKKTFFFLKLENK